MRARGRPPRGVRSSLRFLPRSDAGSGTAKRLNAGNRRVHYAVPGYTLYISCNFDVRFRVFPGFESAPSLLIGGSHLGLLNRGVDASMIVAHFFVLKRVVEFKGCAELHGTAVYGQHCSIV